MASSQISIRAPARGATGVTQWLFGSTDISIRAPARGATILPNRKHIDAMHFNPRSREGSDTQPRHPVRNIHIFQSALPRGERLYIRHGAVGWSSISIRAPARGATLVPWILFIYGEFQSALPRGERPKIRALISSLGNFNPRSREGSDQKCSALSCFISPFQSALPRGERLACR